MSEPVFTAEALRAMRRHQELTSVITALVEIEHDLKWVWFESPPDLQDPITTALSAVHTATQAVRQANKETP